MTPDTLRVWQATQNYTQQQAADALGINRASFAKLLDGRSPIDRRTALACAAISAGLEPAGE